MNGISRETTCNTTGMDIVVKMLMPHEIITSIAILGCSRRRPMAMTNPAIQTTKIGSVNTNPLTNSFIAD